MLYPTADLKPWETPASFVSRLAQLHNIPTARMFCVDMGISFAAIVAGRDSEVGALAKLAGADAAKLRANAIAISETGYTLRGVSLTRQALLRHRVRVCPHCLQDDITSTANAPAASVYYRAPWSLSSIRTCAAHSLPLLELTSSGRAQRHDFAALAAEHLDSVGKLAASTRRREASGLETYLVGRLDGKATTAPWLDAMPFYAAAKACEMLGAVGEFGTTTTLEGLDEDDWHAAGSRGFAIAAGGPPAIDAYLTDLRVSHQKGWLVANGPSAWFGNLYKWLAHYSEDAAYDPLRNLIVTNLIENVPLAPGERLFGQPVTNRKVHSLRTAFLETGLHPSRLRKALAFTGQIQADHADLSDHAVVFDAAATNALLRRLASALTFLELCPYLNANRVQTKLLIDAGHIRPVLEGRDEEVGWRCYARDDVDAFLAALHRDAVLVAVAPAGSYPIQDAAKRACCHSREIVDLIIARKLNWVGRLSATSGYDAVLVDVDEVRKHVRGQELDGLTVSAATKVLRLGSRTVNALIAGDVIATAYQRHPVNRAMVQVIPEKALERFRLRYVSLFALAEELGAHHVKLKRALAERGIHVALAPDQFHASFYLREDIRSVSLSPGELGRTPGRRGPAQPHG